MGLLRFLLALVVVVGHLNYLAFMNGNETVTLFNHDFAVLIFFIISGYYMCLILSTKKAYNNYFVFIKARYLRLYPLYFLIVVLTLVLLPILPQQHGSFSTCVSSGKYVLFGCIMSNSTLIGLDAFPWFTFNAVQPGNLLPQAWSIGSEILFYLVIPFFFARRKLILVLLAIGLTSNYIWHNHQIWNTNFSNYYLFYYFFLIGAASYHFIKPFELKNKIVPIVLPLLIVSCLSYGLLPTLLRHAVAHHYFWYLLLVSSGVALALPTLFKITKNNKRDKFIGELSYPIYMIHVLVIHITRHFSPIPLLPDGSRNFANHHEAFIVITTTLFCAVLYNIYINPKIERFRFKVQRTTPNQHVELAPSSMAALPN